MRRPFKLFSIAAIFALLVNSTLLSTARASEANNAVQSAPNSPLLVPDADTVLSIHPLERVMIGEDFEFYASFDNFAETGYGPFIDLIFPTNGADGAAGTDTPDGIDFVSGKYDGYTLPATSLVFPDDDGPLGPGTTGCVAHPLAVDASGSAVQVCGTAGDTLTVLELPFSSVTQGMSTMISVDITAHVSELADVDTPLTILGRGGYRFGADSLNNPSTDPAILTPSSTDGSGWPSLQVTPRIIAIEKSFNGHQECPYYLPAGPVLDETRCYGEVDPVYESVSGPNFPGQYDINIYVAAGRTVTDLDVTDEFPNNLAFLSVDSLGSGTLVDSPAAGEGVEVRVTVTNQGSAPAEPFWVDLYINPSSPPTAANQVWNTHCGMTPCFGMAWEVPSGLAPGQSITLSSLRLPAGYSVWPGYFAAGTSDLYAYVDSYKPGVVAGAVAESDESNNRAELHGLTVTGPNPALRGMEVGRWGLGVRPKR